MKRRLLKYSWLIGLLLLLSTGAQAATYGVGSGQTYATPNQVKWDRINPGDIVEVHPGFYPSSGFGDSMTISALKGTASNPITIKATSTTAGQRAVLQDGLSVTNGSEYLNIVGFEVSRPPVFETAAVVVNGASRNINLSDLVVHDSHVGVSIFQAGLQNTISKSLVYNNRYHGVTVGRTAASVTPNTSTMSSVTGNQVYDNGSHGIDVTGPYWTISRNQVLRNGRSEGGTSGIHLFSNKDEANDCDFNQIIYNQVSLQHDTSGADGNGIQIDHFCDNNTVAFNVVWKNDGAGISLLVGKSNKIFANTSYSNAQDLTRPQRNNGAIIRAEIILASEISLCENRYIDVASCNIVAGRASENVIYDNLVYSSVADVPGIHVTPDFSDRSRNTNYLYPNMYWHALHNPNLNLSGSFYSSSIAIDNATGFNGNLVELPKFRDAGNAGQYLRALSLAQTPSLPGWLIRPAMSDIDNKTAGPGTAYFGAFYTPGY